MQEQLVDMDTIFGTTGAITWSQECARAILIFFYGLAVVRLSGRRMFGKWSALDVIVSIVIGSNFSRALTGNADLWGTLLATTVIIALHSALAHFAARSIRMSALLEGRAVLLGANGTADQRLLVRHGVSKADLEEALRSAGVDATHGARLLMLEPSGKISVLKSAR